MRLRVALLALLLAVTPFPARAGDPCDWPMYGRDIGHSFSTDCSSIGMTNASTLRPRWFVPANDSVTASPSVAGGTVYVGAWDGVFYALDAQDGGVKWTFRIADEHPTAFGRIVSSAYVGPVGVDGIEGKVPMVLFGGGATLYALDPATGELLASVDVDPRLDPSSDPDAQVEIESSPSVADFGREGDRVFVGMDVHNGRGVGRTGMLSFEMKKSDGDTPYRFELKWKFDPERLLTLYSLKDTDGSPGFGCGGVWSSPAVDPVALGGDGLVFFGTANCEHPEDSAAAGEIGREGVFAVSAKTGALQWHFTPRGLNNLDDDFGASPNLLPGNAVGIGGKDGWYYAFDRVTGAVRWRSHAGQAGHVSDQFAVGGIIGTPAVGKVAEADAIFVTTALSTPVGDPLGSGPPDVDESLAEDPGRMFSLHAIDAATGAVLWRTPLSRQSYGAPTYANGVLFVPSTFSLMVLGFEANTGAPLFATPTLGASSSAPAITSDAIFFGTGTRETDLEFKAFGDELGDAFESVLGEHPLSRLSGIASYGL